MIEDTDLTSQEIAECIAFEDLSPRGDLRTDYHFANLMYLLASIHRRKGHKPKFDKFLLPQVIGEKKKQSQAQIDNCLKMWLMPLARKKVPIN